MSLRTAATSLLLLWTAVPLSAAELAPHVPGEVLVKWHPSAKAADVESSLGLSAITTVGSTGAVLYAVEADVEPALAALAQDAAVEYAEPNYLWSIDVSPDDPSFDEQWALDNVGQVGGTPGADISAVAAWANSTGSKSVVVAVIDTGIDLEHPDLAANLYVNPGEIEANGLDDDGNGFVDDVHGWDFLEDDNLPVDDNGHGTHVAGITGAVGDNGQGITGVAWRVSLLPLKFLDWEGRGDTVAGVRCVEYATLAGVDVINASWGGAGFSRTLAAAIEDAEQAGIVFVASAGNAGNDIDARPHFPASYELSNVVSVASSDGDDRLSTFSNYGVTSVDLAAPGTSILSTVPGRTYDLSSGTSMATPHVAGTFALLRAILPQVPVDVAIARVLDSVDPRTNLKGLVRTGGRLNAHRAIADPDTVPPSPIADLAVAQAGSNWLELSWTATGDDLDQGSATRYELRIATFVVNEVSWEFATALSGLDPPAAAGEVETFRVDGLDFATSYSFALMAFDDFGNPSALSNGVTAVTLGPPTLATDPSAVTDAVATGAVVEHVVQLSNTGEGTLDFALTGIEYGEASSPRATPPSAFSRSAYATSGARAPARRLGPRARAAPVLDFGQALKASDILFFDDFEAGSAGWTHVSTAEDGVDRWRLSSLRRHGGTSSWNVVPHDFAGSDALQSPPIDLLSARAATLSFFHWYDFDDCGDPTFEADGGIVEISLDDGLSWQRIAPVGGYPYVLDAVCGNPLAPGGAFAHRDAADDAFLPAFFDLTPVIGHVIRLRFHTGWDCGNCQGREGWYVDDVMVTRALPPWATVDPLAGTVWAGTSLDLTFRFDATGLFGGSYLAQAVVSSNDPLVPELRLPLTLEVTGAPDLFVAEASVEFGTVFLSTTASRAVSLYNLGDVPLSVTDVAADGPFTAAAEPFTLEAFQMRTLTVAFTPAVEGAASGTLRIASDDPDRPSATVALSATATPPPRLIVSPSRFEVSLAAGASATHTLTLRNDGPSELQVRLTLQPAPRLAAGVVPATPGRAPGAGPPSASGTAQPVEVRLREQLARPSVLVVQNTLAWGLDVGAVIEAELGVRADVVGAAQLDAVRLDDYDLVVTVSDEDDAYYQLLSAQAGRLEDYVRRGGVLQVQAATHGADVLLPGGATARWGDPEMLNRVVLRDHPATAGLPASLEGDGANHNVLTDLPAEAVILTETFDSRLPTTAELALGRGLVLVTGMTWEFLFERGFAAGRLLPQALAYSFDRMRVGGLPWVFVTQDQVRVGGHETIDVDLAFDDPDDDEPSHRALLVLTTNDPARPQTRVPLELTVTGLTARAEDAPRAGGDRPASLALEPLGPNPGRGGTLVQFALPSAGSIRLAVYDVRGRLVRLLLEDRLPAGRHTARWSGLDGSARPVAAGVYFLRIEHAGHTATARLVMGR